VFTEVVTVAPVVEVEVTVGVPGAVLTTVGDPPPLGGTPPLLTVARIVVDVKVEV